MALDSRFILQQDLQGLFRDKTTGEPLRNGVIYFWKDQARTEPKPVYQLTGYPTYEFVELPNPLDLTGIGTYSNGVNPATDIAIYWFPYEGDPEDNSDVIELYYVEVYSEGGKTTGVLQFTREAWPNQVSMSSAEQDLENFVPNPQFRDHTDLPATGDYDAGEVRAAITEIAQGGWTFERPGDPSPATSEDYVFFDRFGSISTDPSANPRYAVRISCENATGSGDFKDLRLKFNNVNKFASDTQFYTFYCEGQNMAASGDIVINLFLIKNYGTNGGSTQQEEPIGSMTFDTSWTKRQISFSFGLNEGQSLGEDDNDFVQIAMRFPLAAQSESRFTNFILTPEVVTITTFPEITDSYTRSQAIAGWMPDPNPDGSDLYLPLRLTKAGLEYDRTQIGRLGVLSYNGLEVAQLYGDGARYEYAAYSDDGIPYSRLGDKYWDDTLKQPIYGTGPHYFISYITDADEMRIVNNTGGDVTSINANTSGFTVSHIIHEATAATYYCKSVFMNSSVINLGIYNTFAGVCDAAADGAGGDATNFSFDTYRIGTSSLKQIVLIDTLAATSLAGKYFTFATHDGSSEHKWYVWFQVSGSGTDPAPGGGHVGIKINLTTGDDKTIVAKKIAESLNSVQSTVIGTVAASSITDGTYFSVYAATASAEQLYVIWFDKGAHIEPVVATSIKIKVTLIGSETAAEVADAVRKAINRAYYAVPDYRGYFLRVTDDGAGVDLNNLRFSYGSTSIVGDFVGTIQMDDVLSHFHKHLTNVTTESGVNEPNIMADTGSTSDTLSTGRPENTVWNRYVNVVVYY